MMQDLQPLPQPSPSEPLSICVIAAEESGDALGAALARALTRHEGGAIELSGIGGRAMAAAGIKSAFPIDELAIKREVEKIGHK